jgi:drug/metabolite transporter (DMT)-like permease
MNLTKNRKGIMYIILAALSFSLMTFFVKLSGDIPTFEKAFFRNLPAFFISFAMLLKAPLPAREGEDSDTSGLSAARKLGLRLKPLKTSYVPLFLRCSFGLMGVICNFWAIDHLALPDSNILNKMSPFFAVILSAIILKERPSRFEWITLVIAFIGVLFVVKPTAGLASVPALIGLLSGFGAGVAYTFVRRMGMYNERRVVIVFWFSAFSVMVLFPLMLTVFEPLTLKQFLILMCAGLGGAGGQLSITAAYSAAPAKEISVFDYAQVLFAALWGALFLAELPDVFSVIGYIIIIGVAVIRWRRST